jgi:hypothetical protein
MSLLPAFRSVFRAPIAVAGKIEPVVPGFRPWKSRSIFSARWLNLSGHRCSTALFVSIWSALQANWLEPLLVVNARTMSWLPSLSEICFRETNKAVLGDRPFYTVEAFTNSTLSIPATDDLAKNADANCGLWTSVYAESIYDACSLLILDNLTVPLMNGISSLSSCSILKIRIPSNKSN